MSECFQVSLSWQETPEDEKPTEKEEADSQWSGPGSKAASAGDPTSEVEDEEEGFELHEAVCESLYDMPQPSEDGPSASEGENEGDTQAKLSSSAGTFKECFSNRCRFLAGHTAADRGTGAPSR